MKKQDLEGKLRDAYESETPELFERIKASCAKETPSVAAPESSIKRERGGARRRVLRYALALSACVAILLSGFLLYRLIPTGDDTPAAPVVDAFVYIDVNPSVELQLDAEGRVLACNAGNEDAERVLSDLSLEGMQMNSAILAIVGSMHENGYLTLDTSAVLISVDAREDAHEEVLLSAISTHVSAALDSSELSCAVFAQSVRVTDALRQLAADEGISVGKAHLAEEIKRTLGKLSGKDAEALFSMSITELCELSSTLLAEAEAYLSPQLVQAVVNAFLSDEGVLAEYFDVSMCLVRDEDGAYRPLYEVDVSLEEGVTRSYRVDPQTGEIKRIYAAE